MYDFTVAVCGYALINQRYFAHIIKMRTDNYLWSNKFNKWYTTSFVNTKKMYLTSYISKHVLITDIDNLNDYRLINPYV